MEKTLLVLWFMLNVLIWIGFVRLIWQVVGRVSERYGRGSATILFLLILSTCGSQNNKPVTDKEQQARFTSQIRSESPADSATYTGREILFDSPLFAITSYVSATPVASADSAQLDNSPVLYTAKVLTSQTGLVGGVTWNPIVAAAGFKSGQRLAYVVHGQFIWSLLNIPIYRQNKEYKKELILY